MTKEKFINFLLEQESDYKTCWKRTYSNSNEYWKLYRPSVDWMADNFQIKEDKIIIKYDLCTSCEGKKYESTFDEFVENYKRTVSRY